MHLNICDSFNDENKRLTYQFINELIKKKNLCSIVLFNSCNLRLQFAMTVTLYVCIYWLCDLVNETVGAWMFFSFFFNCVCEFINAHMLS